MLCFMLCYNKLLILKLYAGNNWSDGPDGLSTRKFGLKKDHGVNSY